MTDTKTIVIIGATGAQGGSVIKHLLPLKNFKLKALTRKPISVASKALADQGVEIVAADLGNVDSLRRAFKGAWGVFGLTNYWEHSASEHQHGINMIDIAKEMGVKFFVWSSVDHQNASCGSKDEVTTYLRNSGLPHAVFFPALYFENVPNMWSTPKGDFFEISIPAPADSPLLWYSVEDTGAYVKKAFVEPELYNGKEIRAGTEWKTPTQVVDILNKSMKEKYILDAWDKQRFDEFAAQGPLTSEIHSIMDFFIAHPENDPIREKKEDVKCQTLSAFVANHHSVLNGAPRQNLAGSGTYIPTSLRSSLEGMKIQPELQAH